MTKKQKKELIRIVIASILFLYLLIFNHLYDIEELFIDNYGYIIKLLLFFGLYLFIGYDVLLKAIRNILKLDNVNSCTINFMLETLIIDINDDVFDNTLTEVEKVIKKVEKDCYIKR